MNSPVGSHKPLESVQLTGGLAAYRCPETGGHYITSAAYMWWLGRQPARFEHLPASPDQPSLQEEHPRALLCPESGTIMLRFKVGHGFRFSIDRSLTGGVWLDAGEWEALQQRNFHDEIHYVFTEPWQHRVREQEAESGVRERLASHVGPELLEKIDALKTELASHPNRAEILAYLMRG